VGLAVFLYSRGEADVDGRPDADILEPDSPATGAPATTAPATTAPGGGSKPPADGGERASDLLAARAWPEARRVAYANDTRQTTPSSR
jgi:hypothetical protein